LFPATYASITSNGGWHHVDFVTDGIDSALKQAKEAANGKDVRIGGGVSLIRQYLSAGQLDEMQLAISSVLMGEGEHPFAGINLQELGFAPVETVAGESAAHVLIRRR
jgi:dihydrofolate reductase